MGKALYRKYRSKKLSEIVGQEHITTALERALDKGFISHAYLFTGPHGVGKTSIARILAHEVNNFNYDERENYLDIIEIDAASNRRIDEIRDLREKVHSAPTSGKYKVYIIDEVHMLTKEAFNALLKTLEEPPKHVIFILATTEAHKLPDTIISRTQRYSFKPVNQQQAVKHLASIAKTENIDITNDALELVADHGAGSFRDSISLLDQLGNQEGRVDRAIVKTMLGLAEDESINNLLGAVGEGNISKLIQLLSELRQYGSEAGRIAQQLSDQLRKMLINEDTTLLPVATICSLLKNLIDVGPSRNPDVMLEVCLVEAASKTTLREPNDTSITESMPAKISPSEDKSAKKSEKAAPLDKQTPSNVTTLSSRQAEVTDETVDNLSGHVPITISNPNTDEVWQKVMNDLKKSYNTLYSVVRMAQAELQDGSVNMIVAFPFHQRRLSDDKNKRIILDLLEKHSGTKYKLVSATVSKPKRTSTQKENKSIESITNIFGGGEVLE